MKKKVMMGILLVLTFSIVACGSNTKKTESSNLATAIASWQKQYDLGEYSCAVTPQVRQTGNRLSGLAGTAYASLLA